MCRLVDGYTVRKIVPLRVSIVTHEVGFGEIVGSCKA